MIKYIYDEDGNKTDVQIPFELWEKIKLNLIDKHLSDEFEEIDNADNFYHTDYLHIHYIDIIDLFLNNNGKEIQEAYEHYFDYYNSLSAYDIELLYIFRGGTFFNLRNKNFNNHAKTLSDIFELTTLNNLAINEEQFNSMVIESHRRNEISFLQYFKMNFKINRKIKSIRLNRKTERDRLFIYDMLHSTFTIENIIMAKGLEKTEQSINSIKKHLLTMLSNFFYNGNKAQVYRAQKEVSERLLYTNSNFKM